MANDCLVTKLKSIVNNDALTKLGVLKLNVRHYDRTISSGYQYELNIKVNADVKVTVDGDGYFTVGSDTLNNPSTRKTEHTITTRNLEVLYFKYDSEYNIEITNKYAIVEIYTHQLYGSHKIISPVVETLNYCTSLQKIDFEYTDIEGDIKWLNKCSALKEVFFSNCNISGDINAFRELTNIETLRMSPAMTGDLSSLSNLTNMKEININKIVTGNISSLSRMNNIERIVAPESVITGNISVLNKSSLIYTNFQYSNVEGQIDDLTNVGANATSLNFYNQIIDGSVEGFVGSKAAPSSPIYMVRVIQYATFGGVKRTGYDCHLGWESSSKIYVLAGNSSAASCTTVYTKGYSQGEAETKWPGKTIVRVDA